MGQGGQELPEVDAAVVPRTLFAAILIRINLLRPVPETG